MKAADLPLHTDALNPYLGFDVITSPLVPDGECWLVTDQRIVVVKNLSVFMAPRPWYKRLVHWVVTKVTGGRACIWGPTVADCWA